MQIVPVTLTSSRRDIEVHTNALLDAGSDTPLIGKDIAGKLKLTGIRMTMNISNADTNTRKLSAQVVNFIMTSQTNKYDCFNIDDGRVMNKLNMPNNEIDEVVINKLNIYMMFPFQNQTICHSFDSNRPHRIIPRSII